MANALVPKPNLISLVIHYVKMCVAWAKAIIESLNRNLEIACILHVFRGSNDQFVELYTYH